MFPTSLKGTGCNEALWESEKKEKREREKERGRKTTLMQRKARRRTEIWRACLFQQ